MSGEMIKAADLKTLAGRINQKHEEFQGIASQAVTVAIETGRLLLEAKEQVGHGKWLAWIKANCTFSDRTAQGYMRMADRAPELESNPQRVADLPLRDALAMLAKPKEGPGYDVELAADRWTEAFQKVHKKLLLIKKYGGVAALIANWSPDRREGFKEVLTEFRDKFDSYISDARKFQDQKRNDGAEV